MPTLGVVLDTNVLLSGLAYPASVPGRLIAAWRFGALDLVLSDFILVELRRTLLAALRLGLVQTLPWRPARADRRLDRQRHPHRTNKLANLKILLDPI